MIFTGNIEAVNFFASKFFEIKLFSHNVWIVGSSVCIDRPHLLDKAQPVPCHDVGVDEVPQGPATEVHSSDRALLLLLFSLHFFFSFSPSSLQMEEKE